MRPNYVYFYKSDKAIDDILKHPPFSYDIAIDSRIGKDEARFIFTYYDLRCYRMNHPTLSFKGIKTWQVIVEDILYDEMDMNYISDVLYPMTATYGLVGGNVRKLYKWND